VEYILYHITMCEFWFIVVCFERTGLPWCIFLKCLHKATPFDGPDSLKCLPHRLNVYCANALRYNFVPFFWCLTSLVQWSMLVCCLIPLLLFLFESTLKSWGPAVAVWPLRDCSLLFCSSTFQGRHHCFSSRCLLRDSLHDSCSSLIQLCKFEVIPLQFDLFVVVRWFVVLQICKMLDLLLQFQVFRVELLSSLIDG